MNFYKQLVKFRKQYKVISDGSIEFIEKNNDDVLAYKRKLDAEELIVLCNFRANEVNLQEKSAAQYLKDGYQKLIGNYDKVEEHLRPFEVVVLKK